MRVIVSFMLAIMTAMALSNCRHECYDETHAECDSVCVCDGIECP